MLSDESIMKIAQVAYEANRAYCAAFMGDDSQLPWEQAPQWQRQSTYNGVKFVLDNPHASPEDAHESWRLEKFADGWVYGEEKNAMLKTHPCMVSYEELPAEQRTKDYLYLSVVKTLLGRLFAVTGVND